MDQVEFLRIVESAAAREPESLGLEARLQDIGWDSLAVVILISELDRLGGYSLDVDSAAKAGTVRDLYFSVFA